MTSSVRASVCAGLAAIALSCGPTLGSTGRSDFVVDVSGERFVLRVTDQETVRLAYESLRGANARFPIGPVRRGDGGFNRPWSWHIDPAEARLTEVSIESCDGQPSYVEAHVDDFPIYCPWGGRIVEAPGEPR